MLSVHDRNTLTIVIPALNEEDAIAGTVARCLEARAAIRKAANLADVEIIVVSDGSTDRTAEIARSFSEIHVIEFPKNRGYGAAISEGFRQGGGNLVGFLDADGTCDPAYFAELCRQIVEENAEIALGSRLGPESKMPGVRRLGNRLYALLLGVLTGRSLTDSASGMRVMRRDVFEQISPLPDGLHFTPAMSARALINGTRIVEVPMAYSERVGDSKLNVLRDGVRFLRTIVAGILIYRPDRLFTFAFLFCLVAVGLMGIYPVEYYWHHRQVEDWMIYRFLACFFLSALGFLLISAIALSHEMARFGPTHRATDSFWSAAISQLFRGRAMIAFTTASTIVALALLWPGIVEYATTAKCSLHWSRVVVASFFLLMSCQTLMTAVLVEVVKLWSSMGRARSPRQPRETAAK